jgi:hypothetical protein
MSEKRTCPLCGEALEDAPVVHDLALCEKTELLKGRQTIKELQVSVANWRSAWDNMGQLVGRLSWEHHDYVCPHQPKPVREAVPNTWLHPDQQFVQQGKLAYAKIPGGWKLIGAGSSEDAAAAIIRLMKMRSNK